VHQLVAIHENMSDTEPILVDDFATLFALIQSSDFWVKWEVRCDIGPEWIGGGRSIQFYLDQRPLADTPVHNQLKDALINALTIPDNSSDAVISGEGTITRLQNALEIEYEWSEAVPYMDSRDSGFGKALLLALS
jgi:hypothetical protein